MRKTYFLASKIARANKPDSVLLIYVTLAQTLSFEVLFGEILESSISDDE